MKEVTAASEADDDPDPRHYQVKKIKNQNQKLKSNQIENQNQTATFSPPHSFPQYIGAKDRLRTPQAVAADTITESARYHFAPKSSY